MIKPATLWGLFKSCDNSEWLGTICRALGGQEVALDYGQSQMLVAIKQDSGWMDEAMEARRSKWRDQKRGQRGQFGKLRTIADIAEMSTSSVDKNVSANVQRTNDVRECPPPSFLPSSLPTLDISNDISACVNNAHTRTVPDEQTRTMFAHQMGISDEYLAKFTDLMEKQDWTYISSGHTVRVTAANFKAVLGAFHRRDRIAKKDDVAIQQDGYKVRLGQENAQ